MSEQSADFPNLQNQLIRCTPFKREDSTEGRAWCLLPGKWHAIQGPRAVKLYFGYEPFMTFDGCGYVETLFNCRLSDEPIDITPATRPGIKPEIASRPVHDYARWEDQGIEVPDNGDY